MSKHDVLEHRYQAIGGAGSVGGRITATHSTRSGSFFKHLILDTGGRKGLVARVCASVVALAALTAPFAAGYPDCTGLAQVFAIYFFSIAALASLALFVDGIRDVVGFFAAFFAPASVITSVLYIALWVNLCHL